MTPQEAYDRIIEHVRPLGVVRAMVGDSLGHCLAENVRADRDLPPADRSAMDGYAVRSADLVETPVSLRLAGEVAAGSPARPKVAAGTCVRILTGANVPPGADAVAIVESTEDKGGQIVFRAAVELGENILRKGEDTGKGAVVLRKGAVMGAAQVGLCAAIGKIACKVHRLPRVAVLSTGSELRRAADSVGPHQMRDSNGPMIEAVLREWGLAGVSWNSVRDDLKLIAATLRRLLARNDVVISTGGVSVGKHDLMAEAVALASAKIRVHGVAMKPGKPLLYAAATRNRHVFGLPGNPMAAMVGMHEFVLPALSRLAGRATEECRPAMAVVLASPVRSKGDRQRMMPVCLQWLDGKPAAVPVESRSSADLVATAHADGCIVVPAGVREIVAGSCVEFRPWRRVR